VTGIPRESRRASSSDRVKERSRLRFPYWMRDGYTEEVYLNPALLALADRPSPA